jgi:hypothetical protein
VAFNFYIYVGDTSGFKTDKNLLYIAVIFKVEISGGDELFEHHRINQNLHRRIFRPLDYMVGRILMTS